MYLFAFDQRELVVTPLLGEITSMPQHNGVNNWICISTQNIEVTDWTYFIYICVFEHKDLITPWQLYSFICDYWPSMYCQLNIMESTTGSVIGMKTMKSTTGPTLPYTILT